MRSSLLIHIYTSANAYRRLVLPLSPKSWSISTPYFAESFAPSSHILTQFITMAAAVPPTNQIGIYSQFITQQPEQLVLKEKVLSLSGDSFSIKTVDGRVVFNVKGDLLSLSGRKHLMDAQDVPLFDIRKQLVAIHATYYCENPQGERIFEVKSKFSSEDPGYFLSALS